LLINYLQVFVHVVTVFPGHALESVALTWILSGPVARISTGVATLSQEPRETAKTANTTKENSIFFIDNT